MENSNRITTTSERLKSIMAQKEVKQVDLVKATGLNRSAISRYISGEYEPKSDAIYALSKALDVSEMWLWGYDVPMERPLEQTKAEEIAALVKSITDDPQLRRLLMYYMMLSPEQKDSIEMLSKQLSDANKKAD